MMKKTTTLLAAAASLLICSTASAQDFAKATELAKQANEALIGGDTQTAASSFEAALKEATACTDEGVADLVSACKKGIVQSVYKAANDLIDNGNISEAIAKLKETVAVAAQYGESELGEKANELKFQLHQKISNEKIKAANAAKDAAEKIATYKEANEHLDAVIAADPENGKAFLQKGQVLSALGDKTKALEAFIAAKAKGQEEAASKQISNIYLKDAQTLMKTGKIKEAIAACNKATEEFAANANAYKLAGIYSQKAGDLKGAVEYLEKYLQLKPDDSQIKKAVDAIKASIK